MLKGIQLENSTRPIVNFFSIVESEDIENNLIGDFMLISDYTDPPEVEVESHMIINYPVYDRVNKILKWITVKYQNTPTNELLEIENVKVENIILKNQLQIANENIDMLTGTIADMIGGAI